MCSGFLFRHVYNINVIKAGSAALEALEIQALFTFLKSLPLPTPVPRLPWKPTLPPSLTEVLQCPVSLEHPVSRTLGQL